MKHLYFCRHGLSVLGQQGLWAGSTNTSLAKEGRDQAKAAGREAAGLHIDYIISSPLVRAYDTAAIIAAEIGYSPDKIERNDLVVERNFGELEGTPWDPTFNLSSVPSVEPLDSLMDRAQLMADYLETLPHDTILIVSHGSFGRALRDILNPDITFKGNRLENAKIMEFIQKDRGDL
jgi:broad specificity phosphatase PhoE